MKSEIHPNTFFEVDIRVGTIIEALPAEGTLKPAYRLTIDFGPEIGLKKSSAQLTDLYQPSDLTGTQVTAVVNFPPKQIGKFISECLVLGAVNDKNKEVVLLRPERKVENGLSLA